MKTMTFGMLVWAVRCGFINESTLCAKLKWYRGLLYQVVSLCNGPGLVDVDVITFVRCFCLLFLIVWLMCLFRYQGFVVIDY